MRDTLVEMHTESSMRPVRAAFFDVAAVGALSWLLPWWMPALVPEYLMIGGLLGALAFSVMRTTTNNRLVNNLIQALFADLFADARDAVNAAKTPEERAAVMAEYEAHVDRVVTDTLAGRRPRSRKRD